MISNQSEEPNPRVFYNPRLDILVVFSFVTDDEAKEQGYIKLGPL